MLGGFNCKNHSYQLARHRIRFRSGSTNSAGRKGIIFEGYDLWRVEVRSGTPVNRVWTPLRFPGQYYDQETDLFENWNRFYDPSVGRYLSPDPILLSPGAVVSAAAAGTSYPAYAYAGNNPIGFTDPTGLLINYLDSRGNQLTAGSSSEDLMAMFMGLEVVDTMATSSVTQVAEAVTELRDGTNYEVNVYVNVNGFGANAVTRPVPTSGAREAGPLGGSHILMNPASKITGSTGGPGYDANGNWNWLGVASNFQSTFAHELGHAAFNMSRWGVGPRSDAVSGDWAIQFRNAYVQDPRSVPATPYRPGFTPTQWGPHP